MAKRWYKILQCAQNEQQQRDSTMQLQRDPTKKPQDDTTKQLQGEPTKHEKNGIMSKIGGRGNKTQNVPISIWDFEDPRSQFFKNVWIS